MVKYRNICIREQILKFVTTYSITRQWLRIFTQVQHNPWASFSQCISHSCFFLPWYLKKYSSIIILYNIHFNAPKRTYLIYKLAHLHVPNRLFLLLFYMIKTLRYILKSCLLAFKYPVGFVSVTLATAKFGMLTE